MVAYSGAEKSEQITARPTAATTPTNASNPDHQKQTCAKRTEGQKESGKLEALPIWRFR